MSDLRPFDFDGRKVRVVVRDGEPWFVASDVARILGFRDAANAARMLDADEKGTHIVRTPGGEQTIIVVSLSGLFSLFVKSRVPEAKPFRRWVTHVVLPAIHRTGRYEFRPEDLRGVDVEIALLNHDVQRDCTKAQGARQGNKDLIIRTREGLCIAVTGQHPKEVREQGRALGFSKRERESAPQVLRTLDRIESAVYAGMALMVANGTSLADAARQRGPLEDSLLGVRAALRAGGVDTAGLGRMPREQVERLIAQHEERRRAADRQLLLDLFPEGEN
jgi:prophage antirepressor-like protein